MSKKSIVTKAREAKKHQNNRRSAGIRRTSAFTIVELLIVIVIIGILAAITIVSYSGITKKANDAALQSDLTNASKKLNMYYALYNAYPTAMTSTDGGKTYCPTAPTADTNYCIKPSNDTTFTYSTIGTSDFTILATKGNNTYSTTKDSGPTAWITIGTQTWASKNLNVGAMVAGATNQTNNGILEKYCYDNNEANCTKYGGLYQWDEAMQYVTTEGAQGICPAGSHIPTDTEWKTLEMQLGMTQVEADKQNVWRGTDQGARLKMGGASGLEVPFAGKRSIDSLFQVLTAQTYLWTSNGDGLHSWFRHLASGNDTVYRGAHEKYYGFSIRCLGN